MDYERHNQDLNILVMTRLLTSGGAERVASNLATELNKRHSVKVLVFDGSNITYPCEAEIIDLKMPMQKNIVKKALWYIRVLKRTYQIKKNNNITHTISFLNEADLINVITPIGKRIVSVRSHRSTSNKNVITLMKDRFVFNHADKIVALSSGVKDDLINTYKVRSESIRVIYNACDINTIRDKSRMEPDEEYLQLLNGYDVVNAGRLTHQKGQWHLIRAFKKVVIHIPEARLFILGQGPLEQYFKELISENGLSRNVFLLGYKTNPYAYLNKGVLYVFSSIDEGFGNILLEAMACNLPILSTDCLCGPRELIEPGTSYDEVCKNEVHYGKYGVLVPAGGTKHLMNEPLTSDENIMADEIIKLLKDRRKLKEYQRLSEERIKDFSPEEIIGQWEECMN